MPALGVDAIPATSSLLTSGLPTAMSLLLSLGTPETLLHPLATVLEQTTNIFIQLSCNTNLWRQAHQQALLGRWSPLCTKHKNRAWFLRGAWASCAKIGSEVSWPEQGVQTLPRPGLSLACFSDDTELSGLPSFQSPGATCTYHF